MVLDPVSSVGHPVAYLLLEWQEPPPSPPTVRRLLEVVDHPTARLRDIVATHSWPGRSLVGEDGADAAWLILHTRNPPSTPSGPRTITPPVGAASRSSSPPSTAGKPAHATPATSSTGSRGSRASHRCTRPSPPATRSSTDIPSSPPRRRGRHRPPASRNRPATPRRRHRPPAPRRATRRRPPRRARARLHRPSRPVSTRCHTTRMTEVSRPRHVDGSRPPGVVRGDLLDHRDRPAAGSVGGRSYPRILCVCVCYCPGCWWWRSPDAVWPLRPQGPRRGRR